MTQIAPCSYHTSTRVGELSPAVDIGTGPIPRLLYSPEEAAAALNIDRSTVFAFVRTGELPSRRIGRRRLFTREDLLAFIASSAVA